MFLLLLLYFSAATATAQCPLQPIEPPPLETLKSAAAWHKVTAAIAAVEAAVKQFAEKNPGSGIQAIVSYQDNVIQQVSNGIARGSSAPDYNRTVWRIASITKVFTALQLLQLADRNQIQLDAEVHQLLPKLTSTPGVTLRSLATQMSGMVREVPLPCRGDASDCDLTTAQMIPSLNKLPTLWPPNRRPSYSNLGFSLLGRALEKADPSGRTYEQYVGEEILAPLGMHSSGFDLTKQNVL